MRGLGYLQDPPVSVWRSGVLGSAAAILDSSPSTASIRDVFDSPLDQGKTQSCVAHALCSAIKARSKLQGMPQHVDLSRLWVYNRARRFPLALLGGDRLISVEDEGCYPRAAMGSLTVSGICEENVWPWDEAQINDNPSIAAFNRSYDQRGTVQHYRVSDRGGEDREMQVRSALSSDLPVIFGTSVDDDFFEIDSSEPWEFSGYQVGRHMMAIVGYDKWGVDVINSWGTSWGDEGFCKIKWRSFLSPAITTDVYVIESCPIFPSYENHLSFYHAICLLSQGPHCFLLRASV